MSLQWTPLAAQFCICNWSCPQNSCLSVIMLDTTVIVVAIPGPVPHRRITTPICTPRYLGGTSVWRPQSRYTVSRIDCRIKFPQNQRCRAIIALHPPKSRCRTFLRTPSVALSSQCRRQGCGGLMEGIAALLGSENGSRYRGVSQLQSHQSCYSVQLSLTCASLKNEEVEWGFFISKATHTPKAPSPELW